METLTQETLVWARKVGLSPDRVAFLLTCPKYTVSKGHRNGQQGTDAIEFGTGLCRAQDIAVRSYHHGAHPLLLKPGAHFRIACG